MSIPDGILAVETCSPLKPGLFYATAMMLGIMYLMDRGTSREEATMGIVAR
jgi:hypothetical protein